MPTELQNKQRIMPVDIEILEGLELTDAQKVELAPFYEGITGKYTVGALVTGTVIEHGSHGVLVDINYKSNGLIPNYEFSDFELKKITLNEEIEVLLDKLEDEHGSVVLSYQKAKSIKAWNKISELAEKDEPVSGVVTHKVKGGLSIDIGIPAFLPGSQVDIQRVTNFDQFVGQEVECKIIKVNRKRGNVIVSRRKFLEEQRAVDKQKALDVLHEGAVVQGEVKNITSYGAFIDLGGIDGLLHITDMSWGRISHPSELIKIGDTVTVKIISFDKKHEKISLGMKQLAENPWDTIEEKYPLETKLTGRISSITQYGLFVEIEKGIEGLVHISEISWTERMSNLANQFKVGQEIEICVVAISKENRRMSLSIKQLKQDPWKVVADKFKIGDKISGKVTNITDFGIFVQLYNGVDGLVHVSDISWTHHVTHPSETYKKDEIIDAVILGMDVENKKISLGIKQLSTDPWETIEAEYTIGKDIEGTISKITNFGAFVKLPNGIEGLVHISELSLQEVEKAEDVVQVGQTETFKVIKVNKDERKLGLSLKAVKDPGSFPPEKTTEKTVRTFSERKPVKKKPTAARKEPVVKSSLQQALQDFKKQQKDDSENE